LQLLSLLHAAGVFLDRIASFESCYETLIHPQPAQPRVPSCLESSLETTRKVICQPSPDEEENMSTTTEARIPRILEQAPDFKAKSTHGVIQLSDYTTKGKYVLLFSHPSDFTPVCTTEFIEFARRYDDFERLNVQLIGVSIDSIYSHIAWVRDIERNAGVEVKFPVVADLDQKVSQAYGLVHEAASDTATVRAVFAIDPKQNIRAIVYYPMQLGRNVDELIRIFEGLQTIDGNGVSVPANWKLGDPVIVPAPATVEDARKRTNGGGAGLTVETWYLARKDLATQGK
jgi:peroxiredoxin (alkyl hydroperoxide reductase subunit C)